MRFHSRLRGIVFTYVPYLSHLYLCRLKIDQNQANGDVYSDDDAESCISWSRQKSDVSVTMVSNGDISGGNNGGLGVESGIGGYYADHGWSGAVRALAIPCIAWCMCNDTSTFVECLTDGML